MELQNLEDTRKRSLSWKPKSPTIRMSYWISTNVLPKSVRCWAPSIRNEPSSNRLWSESWQTRKQWNSFAKKARCLTFIEKLFISTKGKVEWLEEQNGALTETTQNNKWSCNS